MSSFLPLYLDVAVICWNNRQVSQEWQQVLQRCFMAPGPGVSVSEVCSSCSALCLCSSVITWLNKQLNENQMSRKQEAVGGFETPQAAAGLRLGSHNMVHNFTSERVWLFCGIIWTKMSRIMWWKRHKNCTLVKWSKISKGWKKGSQNIGTRYEVNGWW